MVRADRDNPALKRSFYSEVAFIWVLAFSIFITFGQSLMREHVLTLAIVAAMLGAFATRLTAVALRWHSPRFAKTSIEPRANRPLTIVGSA